MPVLKNAKHELFCRMIVENAKYGLSQGTSYLKAGYRANPAAAETNACRLLKKAEIKARLDELAAPAVKRTRVTVDSLIEQLDTVFAGASSDKQWGAANASATTKAKLTGYLRDKLEITQAREFSTTEELYAAAREEVGEVIELVIRAGPDRWQPKSIADILVANAGSASGALADLEEARGLLEDRAADDADDVTPAIETPEPHRRRTDETAAALALLRPGKRF